MNSRVVSASARSFPSFMSFKEVTDWVTAAFGFELLLRFGLGERPAGSFERYYCYLFVGGDNGSSFPSFRLLADCSPTTSDSFPSNDMFVESLWFSPPSARSMLPPPGP